MVKDFLISTHTKDIHTLQKQYKKIKGDIKKTYVGVGDDGYIVQKKRFDLYGKDLWESRKFTKGVKMEDCTVDFIYYTNSSLNYNRIVYINPNNKVLMKKYCSHMIDAVNTISEWFLQCKYNPAYKYCKKVQWKEFQAIIAEEEEEEEIEREIILLDSRRV